MSFISFRNVSKIYQMGEVEIKALDDMSFDIEKGEFVTILGASGAGKTTVLNILGGMDHLTTGQVFLDGREISALQTRELAKFRRENVGFVPDLFRICVMNFPALSVFSVAVSGIVCNRHRPRYRFVDCFLYYFIIISPVVV